jgi:formylglycine-generating enzyme required for sulfatase activity
MGSSDEDDRFSSVVEKPRHRIRIAAPFAIGRYPITFAEWDQYAASDPTARRPNDFGWGRGKLPVVDISWEDAFGYTAWLARETGRRYRLPSEAEWEYCCRAGSDRLFSGGDALTIKHANFLYLDFGDRPGVGKPTPVGSYPPNKFGLYDMHGNVAEFVADAWHDSFAGAPADGSAWEGISASMWRVVRGGGWDGLPRILRCAFRDWIHHGARYDNVGFRVACDL